MTDDNEFPPYSPQAYDEERARLHQAVGEAIGNWSEVEHALAQAFSMILGIDGEMAKAVFFSAHSFSAKHVMIMAAIKAARPVEHDLQRFSIFKAASVKARKWSSVRNVLAHDHMAVGVLNNRIIGGMMTANYVVPGLDLAEQLDKTLPRTAVKESSARFYNLAAIINKACERGEEASLPQLSKLIEKLPNCPYSVTASTRHRVEALKRQP